MNAGGGVDEVVVVLLPGLEEGEGDLFAEISAIRLEVDGVLARLEVVHGGQSCLSRGTGRVRLHEVNMWSRRSTMA